MEGDGRQGGWVRRNERTETATRPDTRRSLPTVGISISMKELPHMPDGSHTVAVYEIEQVAMPAAPHGQLQLVPAASTGGLQPAHGKAVSGRPFKPGQSGNPAGRKLGSRNKLSELFVAAMRDDFAQNGPSAIAALRERDPNAYLTAIRSMVPSHVIAESADKLPAVNLDELSDGEWAAAADADGNPHDHAMRQARRNKAMGMVLDGKAASVWDATRTLGADL